MTAASPSSSPPSGPSVDEGEGKLSPLERFLKLFADVEPGEGANVVLMFANVFLILTAYYEARAQNGQATA